MAEQIASLGLAVDSSSARTAAEDLRRLAERSAQAEGAQRGLANATEAAMALTRRGWTDYAPHNRALTDRIAKERAVEQAVRGRAAAEQASVGTTRAATAQLEQTNRTVDRLGVRTESSARSYGAMVAAIMRGDLQQANASLATLASRMAVIPALTTPAGAAVAGLTVALGAMAAITVTASLEYDRFNRMLEGTGRRAGQSAGELLDLRNHIGRLSGDYKDATEAVQEFVRWGRIGGAELETWAQAAAIWGRNTGRATSDVARDIMALADGGSDALLNLNEKYGFLTASSYLYIEAVRQQDGELAAMRETMLLADSATIDLMESTDRSTGNIVRWWNEAMESVKGYWQAVKDAGREDNEYLLREAQRGLVSAGQAYNNALAGAGGPGSGAALTVARANMEKLRNEVARLAPLVEAERTQAEADGIAARQQQQAVEATARTQALADERNEIEKHGREVAAINRRFTTIAEGGEAGLAALRQMNVEARKLSDGSWSFSGGLYAEEVAAAEEALAKLTRGQATNNREASAQDATYARLSRQAAAYASELELTADSGDKLSKVERFIKVTRDQLATTTGMVSTAQKDLLLAELASLEVEEKRRQETVAQNAATAREVELTERLSERMRTATDAAERELAVVGMSRRERELSTQIDRIANEALRERIRLTKELGEETEKNAAEYAARRADIDRFEQDRIALARRSADARIEAEGDWRNGARRAMLDIRDANMDYAKMTETVVTDSYGAMTNAITTFARTGKFEIKDMTVAILESMMQMAAQIAASRILMSIMGAFMPTPTSYTPIAQGGNAVYNSYTGIGGLTARGGVFAAGRAVTAFARGGVVDRATPFSMAGGRSGLMGEEGAEAIMPLGRDSSGRLGVRMVGGEAGGGIMLNVQTNVNIDGSGRASTGETTTSGSEQQQGRALGALLTERVKSILVEQSRPGGLLWGMQNGR